MRKIHKKPLHSHCCTIAFLINPYILSTELMVLYISEIKESSSLWIGWGEKYELEIWLYSFNSCNISRLFNGREECFRLYTRCDHGCALDIHWLLFWKTTKLSFVCVCKCYFRGKRILLQTKQWFIGSLLFGSYTCYWLSLFMSLF